VLAGRHAGPLAGAGERLAQAVVAGLRKGALDDQLVRGAGAHALGHACVGCEQRRHRARQALAEQLLIGRTARHRRGGVGDAHHLAERAVEELDVLGLLEQVRRQEQPVLHARRRRGRR
jgi:hypothetical protein